MNYRELVKAIEQMQEYSARKAMTAVNYALTARNWLIGNYIFIYEQKGEDRARYGQKLIEKLSSELTGKHLKGMSATALKTYRQFYITYPQIGQALTDQSGFDLRSLPARIGHALSNMSKGKGFERIKPEILAAKLTFTHFVELLKVDGKNKRIFYERQAINNNWTARQLKRQIGSLLFERAGLSKNKRALLKKAGAAKGGLKIEETIKDPYILEFTGLAEKHEYSENMLETELLNHLQDFLLELGQGFCFEARQMRISSGGEHDRIDLVFYHRVLKCHVLIDLKVREFSHRDAGQMNFYLNYFRENIMKQGDNPPVGIIMCTYKDKTKVKYAVTGMDNKMFVSRYMVALPTEEELERFIKNDRYIIEEETVKYGVKI